MMPPPWFRRFAFAFGIAFATLYVVAVKLDLALFTVYPSISVVLLGTHHSRDSVGPRPSDGPDPGRIPGRCRPASMMASHCFTTTFIQRSCWNLIVDIFLIT